MSGRAGIHILLKSSAGVRDLIGGLDTGSLSLPKFPQHTYCIIHMVFDYLCLCNTSKCSLCIVSPSSMRTKDIHKIYKKPYLSISSVHRIVLCISNSHARNICFMNEPQQSYLLWVEYCPLIKRHVEVLAPST